MNSTGFFDIQVNGYGGIDFNQDDLTADQLHTACERLEQDGVVGVLATIITEDVDRMIVRLANLVRLREADPLAKKIIPGFHIEGPFINPTPGYVGAHPSDAVLPAGVDYMRRLLDASGGLTRLVTLAPECDAGFDVTRMLTDENVTVSAGHCNPTTDELAAAIDSGLSMFTHLGNGCPMQMHRHDNIIQRVLSMRDRLTICFIPDGVHVPFGALRNYIDLIGVENTVVVTDAIAPASLGPGDYTLGRWQLKIGEDMVARAPDGSHLIGSAITMPRVMHNLVNELGLSQADAHKLVDQNPRKAVGLME